MSDRDELLLKHAEWIATQIATARREALEEAARVCDEQGVQMDGFRARECAAAIRALMEKGDE